MKRTVRNIRKDEEKFYFDLVDIYEPGDYEYDVCGEREIVRERMTNQEGEGLFEAARAYIKRHLCKAY